MSHSSRQQLEKAERTGKKGETMLQRKKHLQRRKDSALLQGTNLSIPYRKLISYVSLKAEETVSFSRCSPQSALTGVPQEDGGMQSEISSGYTGRQLALGKQHCDQHKYLSPVPTDIICKLWSHPVCNALGAVCTHKGHMPRPTASVPVYRTTCM